jgi:hypothetical protein
MIHTFTLEKRRAVMDGWRIENNEQPIRLYKQPALKEKSLKHVLPQAFEVLT